MSVPFERIVAEDLDTGYGTSVVHMPGGGTATGNKVGIHTFTREYNVRDFGAVGDGSADDTAAIQAAITAAASAARVVLIPDGTYKVTSSLTCPSRCQLRGSGLESQIQFIPRVNADALFVDDPAGTDNMIFRDFSLAASGSAIGKIGFDFSDDASRIIWSNLYFSGFDGRGIQHDSAMYDLVEHCRFLSGISTNAADPAMALRFPTFANRLIIRGCRFALNDISISIPTAGAAVGIDGCSFEGDGSTSLAANVTSPIRITACKGVSIRNNYFEDEYTGAGYGVIYLDGCGAVTVDANYFNGEFGGTAHSDIDVYVGGASRGVTVSNNYFTEVGTAFVRGGSYATRLFGNRYFNASAEVTSYAAIMALMVNPDTIDLRDVSYGFTYNPGNLADGAGETHSETVTGAAFGDLITVAAPYDLQGVLATAYVSAANTVAVRLQNETTGAVDLASGTWVVRRHCGSY